MLAASFILAFLAAEEAPVPPPVLLRSFGRGEGNYRGSPCVVDLTGDGLPEIIVVRWNELLVFSATGSTVWTYPFKVRCYSGAVVGDVNGDRIKEVIFGDNQGNVYVLNASGKLLPGWPQKVRLGADVRSIACADVDADGLDEVVVFSTLTDSPTGCEPNMYVYEGDGKVKDGWPHYYKGDPHLGAAFDHAGGFNSNLAVGDLDGDGKLECIFPQDYGSVSVFHADGTPVYVDARFRAHGKGHQVHWGEVRAWPDSRTERVKWGRGSKHFFEFTYSPATIADIDLDRRPEVIIVPNVETGKVGPITGSALGVYNLDRTMKAGFDPLPIVLGAITGEGNAAVEANPVAVAGDITGDARREIVVAHVDGTCRAYNFLGKELWSVKVLSSGDCAMSEPILADVTGDERADVIVLSSSKRALETELFVIDGAGEKRMSFKMPFYTLSSPTLADLNGDRVPEMICAATNSKSRRLVHVYSWPAVNPRCVIWPTARGDSGHTACLRGPDAPKAKAAKKEAGESVWSLIAKKERARAGGKDPRLEEAKALARSGEFERSAGLYAELAEADEDLNEFAEALQKAGELRAWVIEGASEGKGATTYIDVAGSRMRGRVVSADEDGVTVSCMGNEMKMSWDDFSPRRLVALARQYAGDRPEREKLLQALADACGLGGR